MCQALHHFHYKKFIFSVKMGYVKNSGSAHDDWIQWVFLEKLGSNSFNTFADNFIKMLKIIFADHVFTFQYLEYRFSCNAKVELLWTFQIRLFAKIFLERSFSLQSNFSSWIIIWIRGSSLSYIYISEKDEKNWYVAGKTQF